MPGPVDLLARSVLFEALSPQQREWIAARLTRHEIPAGSDIVRQGEAGDACYLIESGSVGVFVRDRKLGLVQQVATLEPPETFGEMALVTGEPRTGTCTALAPTAVYRLGQDAFLVVMQQMPNAALGVARTLARRLGALTAQQEVPWVSLVGRTFDARLWSTAPEQLLRQSRMLPLELNGRTLTVAMADPGDVTALDTLARTMPGVRLRVVAANADAMDRFIEAGLGRKTAAPVSSGGVAVPSGQRPAVTFMDDEDRRSGAVVQTSGPQVVSLVEDVVGTGLASGASDIHIEADARGVVVRYRIDGALQPRKDVIPIDFHRPLVSRLKILAKMDISETRKPQDGRISLRANGRMVDLRVSSLPAKLGEKLVLRVLDASAGIGDMKQLFVVEKVRQLFSQMVFRPQGLVMVTGPTGSGKTTTLYSALGARRRPELNVVTVEDPIEYHLDGITQVQVQAEIGTTFGVVLRTLLRQDPDVIMVGELRDHDAARTAVEASMTGHLVLTSVHTNGALDAVMRLADMGVERYAIANGLIGVLHQRLVRRSCPACSEPFEYPEPIIEQFFKVGALLPTEKPVFRRSKGCPACSGTGFKGRMGLFELLVITDAVRDAIASGADMSGLRAASGGAMIDLARYAGVAVGMGLTVPGEVLHLLQKVGA
jgi:type II secretory ATPase GspE/PulE/Tfp pilus assembly ATPase PilB-like protein